MAAQYPTQPKVGFPQAPTGPGQYQPPAQFPQFANTQQQQQQQSPPGHFTQAHLASNGYGNGYPSPAQPQSTPQHPSAFPSPMQQLPSAAPGGGPPSMPGAPGIAPAPQQFPTFPGAPQSQQSWTPNQSHTHTPQGSAPPSSAPTPVPSYGGMPGVGGGTPVGGAPSAFNPVRTPTGAPGMPGPGPQNQMNPSPFPAPAPRPAAFQQPGAPAPYGGAPSAFQQPSAAPAFPGPPMPGPPAPSGFPGAPGGPQGGFPGAPGMPGMPAANLPGGPPQMNAPRYPQAQPMPVQQQPGYGAPMGGAPGGGGGGGYPAQGMNSLQQGFQNMGMGSNAYGNDLDIMGEKSIYLSGMEDVQYNLPQTLANSDARVDPAVFRCTVNAIPSSEELLKKTRLPFGLTLHPFKDMRNLNIIQTSTIVRCRYCRTYINPFVAMPDHRHWKCNLCGRQNDLPDDFCWDPVTKAFGDPTVRPELKNATVEFIAPSEYMLRPPQPALYVFVLDVSAAAIESGYLFALSEQLLINLEHLPGDERTLVSFIAVDSSLHFFQFENGTARPPRDLVIDDVEDAFFPVDTGLLVNLAKNKESIRAFIQNLPTIFERPCSSGNALGAALNVIHEMIADIGGRISVFQASIPNMGPGKLESREDPNNRAGNAMEVAHLGPATDFYKRLALECTGHQVCIDLFLLNSQYADLATLSEMAKFSSGCVYHFPNYHMVNDMNQVKRFERIFARYLTRKIGFEAVLRIRCSRGLSVSNFYGNFFMRSTDLLSLANVNPDSAIAVQVNHEEKLNTNVACFQAALLYTSSKGDRRIRVHTLCLPVVSEVNSIFQSVDLRATMSLICKMGVDRCMAGASLNDAREATINAVVDALGSFRKSIGTGRPGIQSPRPGHLRLFPLMALATLKHRAFSAGSSIRLDDRVAAMLLFRFSPMEQIMSEIYPQLYRLNDIQALPEDQELRPLPLSFEHISRDGIYLLEAGSSLYIYVPADANPQLVHDLFGCGFHQIDEHNWREQDNEVSRRVHAFVKTVTQLKFFLSPPIVVREDSSMRELFVRRLIEDRTDSSFSYFEFLKHLQNEIR